MSGLCGDGVGEGEGDDEKDRDLERKKTRCCHWVILLTGKTGSALLAA